MPKVSVIIPVYGVEKYIERCARSLFEQTLDDIEYLFIDDCTPDKSVEILKRVLEEYPHRKSQVVIHRMEQNSGQAKVREWGMRNARGEYLIHCDSDDWVDVDMYEKMYKKSVSADYDIVVCDYYESDGISHVRKNEYISDKVEETMSSILLKKTHSVLWNKLVKKSIYNNEIIYPIANNAEDYALLVQLAYHSKSFGYVNEPLYFYFYNTSSLTKVMTNENLINRFNQSVSNIGIVESFLRKNQSLAKYSDELDCIKVIEKEILISSSFDKELYKKWAGAYKEIFPRILLNNKINLRRKLRFIGIKYRIYPLIRFMLNLLNRK